MELIKCTLDNVKLLAKLNKELYEDSYEFAHNVIDFKIIEDIC
ncbi:hypothetical protein [Clostridium simiarum]|nr:hypothetical protein [Clostridium simiarum]